MRRSGSALMLCAVVPLLVFGVRDVLAQGSVASGCPVIAAASPSTGKPWPAPLDRRITLRADDIALQQALDRVAEAAGVRLSYSRELLPRERRVCIDRASIAVGDALTALLAGTDLDPLVVSRDQIVLRRRPASAPVVAAPSDDST